MRILIGKADRRHDFAALAEAGEVQVERKGRHPVALDGEVVPMLFPLKFSICPQALKVRWPGDPEPTAASPDPR